MGQGQAAAVVRQRDRDCWNKGDYSIFRHHRQVVGYEGERGYLETAATVSGEYSPVMAFFPEFYGIVLLALSAVGGQQPRSPGLAQLRRRPDPGQAPAPGQCPPVVAMAAMVL